MPTIGSGRITPGTGAVTFPYDETVVSGTTSNVSTGTLTGISSVTGANLGGGDGIYATVSGSNNVVLQFKSLLAGTNITLNNSSDSITINATGSAGGGASEFVQLTDGPEEITQNAVLVGGVVNNVAQLIWSGAANQSGQVLTWNGSSFVFLQPAVGLTSFNVSAGAGLVVAGAAPFDTNGGTITIGMASSGVTPGTYNSVTVDVTGRVIAASIIAGNEIITLSGDVSGTGTNSILTTLASTGVTAGTYSNLSIDSKGRVLTARNINLADIVAAGGAPLNSPTFTDVANIGVRSVTPALNDSSTRIATTSWVAQQGYLASPLIVTGDVSGSGGQNINLTLATVMTAGTYNTVTVDAKGRVIAGSTAGGTGVSSVNISTDSNLTATGGPITSSGTFALSLNQTGVTAGTYNNVTVDAYGRVTHATNISSDTSVTLTGAVTGNGIGTINTTLAPNGVTPGTYTSAVVDATGRVTFGSQITYAQLPVEVQVSPMPFSFPSTPAASIDIIVPVVQATTIPANLAGSIGYCFTTATANATFTLSYIRSGTTVTLGTIVFGAGSNTATFSGLGSATSLQVGDVIVMSTPLNADSTLANVGITILAMKV